MKLLEIEAKELFSRYGIPIPRGRVVTRADVTPALAPPVVLKSQVPVGDRRRKGGVVFVGTTREYPEALTALFQRPIDGMLPDRVLVEPRIEPVAERYVSISYDPGCRQPVLGLNARGGTGIQDAALVHIDPLWGLPAFAIRNALRTAGFPAHETARGVVERLWELFRREKAVLAEINPLFELGDGSMVAGDGKIVLDDHVARPGYRPFLDLGGDIGVLASGGGASLVTLDTLVRAGGRPANYVEYSGNPRAGVVADLTQQVLSRPGLQGCWVVGGTANFTDIYETLTGFVAGLRRVQPKPRYPIVIRRDGPRQPEAFAMLREVGAREGYAFHLSGSETPLARSAAIVVQLAYRAAPLATTP